MCDNTSRLATTNPPGCGAGKLFKKSRRNSLQSRFQMFSNSCLQMSFQKCFKKIFQDVSGNDVSKQDFGKIEAFDFSLNPTAIPMKPQGWRVLENRSSSRCRARRLDSQTTESQRHKAKVWMHIRSKESGKLRYRLISVIYIYNIDPFTYISFLNTDSFWQMVVYGVNFVLLVV